MILKSNGYEYFPQNIQDHTTAQNQITPEYSADSEKIPELEEDWDNGQFADAESILPLYFLSKSDGTIHSSNWTYLTINTMKRILL